jgi:hypothetical protein
MAGARDTGETAVKDGVANPMGLGPTPCRTRDIVVRSAAESAVGYGDVMDASRTDGAEIAAAIGDTEENSSVLQTVAH